MRKPEKIGECTNLQECRPTKRIMREILMTSYQLTEYKMAQNELRRETMYEEQSLSVQ
jgi:hypothetical protein